ncbi:MAG: hypothetical protein ACRC6R_08720 [Bacteroidales bacterium]
MLSTLFTTVKEFLVTPTKAWSRIKDESYDSFLSNLFYPLLAIYSVSAFIGNWLEIGHFSIENSMRHMLAQVTSVLLTFFFSSLLIKELFIRLENKEYHIDFIRKFVGYSLLLKLIVSILLEFNFPSIVSVLSLYSPLWLMPLALIHYFNVPKDSQLKYYIVTVGGVLGLSFIFDKFLDIIIR